MSLSLDVDDLIQVILNASDYERVKLRAALRKLLEEKDD